MLLGCRLKPNPKDPLGLAAFNEGGEGVRPILWCNDAAAANSKQRDSNSTKKGARGKQWGKGGATAATRQEGRAVRENRFPFNPTFVGDAEHKLESRITPKVEGGGEKSTGNALDRLAAVLEKQLVAHKQSTRLPSLTLTKLIKSSNNQIVGTNFFSFKKRCLQLFAEHNVGESIACIFYKRRNLCQSVFAKAWITAAQ